MLTFKVTANIVDVVDMKTIKSYECEKLEETLGVLSKINDSEKGNLDILVVDNDDFDAAGIESLSIEKENDKYMVCLSEVDESGVSRTRCMINKENPIGKIRLFEEEWDQKLIIDSTYEKDIEKALLQLFKTGNVSSDLMI